MINTQTQIDGFIESYGRHRRVGGAVKVNLLFILADLLAIMGSFGLGFFLVNAYDLQIIDFKSFVTYWPYLPAFILVFYMVHLYPGLSLAPAEELRRFTLASTLGHAGIILSLYIEGGKIDAYSVAFMLSLLASVPGFALCRGLARVVFRNVPWWGIPVVIFGAGKTGRLVVDRLIKDPWVGYLPVVMLDDDPALGTEYRGIPILQGVDLGPEIARRSGVNSAIVTMPGVERARLSEIVDDFVRSSYRHYVLIPDFFGMTNIWMSVRDFNGILGLYTEQRLLLPLNRAIKRVLDIVLVILGGLVISPFLLILALLVKLDSRGPVFYGHQRLGRNGQPFKAWKYRSMVRNSREILDELLKRDPVARAEWEDGYKLKNDPRITRMGKLLRKTSLDELPQIWNVLRGEMSLIGPRPIIKDEVAKYGAYYRYFSSLRPGMSGLWQVSGRSDTDYDERVALDVYYIQSWSIWLDLHILFKTVSVVFGGKGAY
ncbi:MAG: undecaprenyl-phosphate galactose phosphotransferase WbaP [Spirochaetae bacterium HGW-Spirochaetae-7]|jgi:Undecaprenyl-phosphate galactose phosphotransferase WbaP|nr:MAG: undecaprenyl-phosphate galactose phosphotransferase WbaP [Spirochaetae bacterium HGW-Spirochaetae-7]